MSGTGVPALSGRWCRGPGVWLADLSYTQRGVAAETMPQAVGGLATYAQTRVDLAEVRIFKYPQALADALADQGPPQVIGFSNYIWNSNLSLGFAHRIKRCFPDTVIVLGGPHYPLAVAEQHSFWYDRLASAVDFYVDGEGEVVFAELLVTLLTGDADSVHGQIPGVHSVDPTGELHLPPPGPRLADLAEVSSPYLAGLMDPFFDGELVPTVQTNRGCPFTCTFCVEGTRYFSKVAAKRSERVTAELHYIGQRIAPLVAEGRGRNELLITDSNFGMFADDVTTCEAIAECQDAYGWPRYVNVTTGKNKRDRVLDAVSRARGAITLSGAVQSLDAEVLGHVRRSNINTEQLMELALAASAQGTSTYSEVILGLPGDSKAKHFASLDGLIAAGFGRVNMFQLSLLPGSQLCTAEARGQFGMRTRWRVVPRCVGDYQVLGSRLCTVEVDETCVALPEMPYTDYRECRRMNLLVAACYNDGPFAAIVKALRAREVSVFAWLEAMTTLPAGTSLARIVEEFLTDQDGQFWSDRVGLLDHARSNIGRYLSGELGNNLIYTARARLLGEGLGDLAELACQAALVAAEAAGHSDEALQGFLVEAAEYHRLRLVGVLAGDAAVDLRQRARFDIESFLSSPEQLDAADVGLAAEAVRQFRLPPQRARVVSGYLAAFGATAAGAGRLLTKVPLADLVRDSALAASRPARPHPGSPSPP